ncbi:MAG: AhpC/TSA family protein [Flavobacteriales bacterium]|nr:AhpC/TSA family protein [Flavobacteriales bacterium]
MMIQNVLFATATSLILMSCGSTDAPVKDQEQVVSNQTEAAVETLSFVNGINEENKSIPSGPITLSGKIDANGARGKVYLYETEGKQHFLIDSTTVENGGFAFPEKTYEAGFYMIALNNSQNMMGIILNPTEKNVEIGFRSARLDGSLYAVNSKENEGWAKYHTSEKAAEQAKKEFRNSSKNSPMKAKFEQMIEEEDRKLTQLQQSLIQQYPGTFLAKVMSWKQIPYKNDKNKYWDDIDFNDESLIHTPIIADRIQDYMRSFSGGTESGFLNAIDLIAQYAEENDRVRSYVVLTMLEGFYTSGKEDMCVYIMDNYVYGENCGSGDYAEEMKMRAKGVRNLQLNATPPDFTITSIDGKAINLESIVSKNKYTLVMFWSSWCHKCEQEIPVLKTVYDQYKSKGFEIIGVSVDTQRSAWVKASEEKGVVWPNVSQLNGWDSPVAKDYRVSSTPTLFLLNSEREIVLKPERIFNVRDYLNQNLK